MRQFISRFLPLLILALLLTACLGSRLTPANLQKVQSGMTTDQVTSILGNPTQAETGSMLGVTGTTYTYKTDTSEVKIVFVNNQVISVTGDFK